MLYLEACALQSERRSRIDENQKNPCVQLNFVTRVVGCRLGAAPAKCCAVGPGCGFDNTHSKMECFDGSA